MTLSAVRQAIAGLLSLAALAVFGTDRTFEAQSRDSVVRVERLNRTLTFSGTTQDRLLEVSTINGAIHVVGHDADHVQVVVVKTVRAATDAAADAGSRSASVSFSESAEVVRIHGDVEARPGCDQKPTVQVRDRSYQVTFDFEVHVPRKTRLRGCAVNGGAIEVEGLTADFDIDHVNGGVRLTDLLGSGEAVTVNGSVNASFAAVPRGALLLRSVNGDLEATFPRDLSADLRLKTFNGELYTDFETIALPSAPEVERQNGRSIYHSNRFGAFRVGSGGPVLTFDAFNGDVRVLAGR
ncbi:MAG: hypothetical protein AB7P22_00445 [Vicinamibacterales bacterium]